MIFVDTGASKIQPFQLLLRVPFAKVPFQRKGMLPECSRTQCFEPLVPGKKDLIFGMKTCKTLIKMVV